MAAEAEKERPHTAMGGESLGELDEAFNATPVMQVRTGHCVLRCQSSTEADRCRRLSQTHNAHPQRRPTTQNYSLRRQPAR